jgi:hypothetical protein
VDKITEITNEQRAKMPEYVKKWVEIGQSTRPMDFERARELVIQIYAKIRRERNWGDSPPQITRERIVACPSPLLAQQAGRLIAAKLGYTNLDGFWPVQVYGSSAARFDFFLYEMGILSRLTENELEAWNILQPMTMICGGVYFAPDFAIIADRPAVLNLIQRGETNVLHCADGPAIGWGRDAEGAYDPNHEFGNALYYWQGTEVPRHWIMEPPTTEEEKKARAIEVLKTENADIRTAGCEILGWAGILEVLEPRVIDEDPNPIFGKLVEVDFPGNNGRTIAVRFIVARCGTGRTVAVPAFPEARTAVEAGAMSYRVTVETYRKLKERT